MDRTMIERTAPSRLHFGLLSLPSDDAAAWPISEGEPTIPLRTFGGAGLMLREPGLRLSIADAMTWSGSGPLHSRAVEVGKEFVLRTPEIDDGRCFAIRVQDVAAEHVGLGTGTQLAMAVADGIATACGLQLDSSEMGKRVGRGQRSAIGVRGYASGGFIVDGGKGPSTAIAPCLVQTAFPDEWQILLAIPQGIRGEHGAKEIEAFAALAGSQSRLRQTEAMSRLLLLAVLPALQECDLATFGEALHDYNRRAGEMFRPVQGGVYSHAITADMIQRLRKKGLEGVGQSSWGPTVFAIGERGRLDAAQTALERAYGSQIRVLITSAFKK